MVAERRARRAHGPAGGRDHGRGPRDSAAEPGGGPAAAAQRNESRSLAALAETRAGGDGPTTTVRIALAALAQRQGERPYVAQAEVALLHGVERLRERQRFGGGESPVQAFALSPDGRILATGLQDGTIELWELATGNRLRVLRRSDASEKTTVSNGGATISREDAIDGLRLAAFTTDGRTLVTADDYATARRWTWHREQNSGRFRP